MLKYSSWKDYLPQSFQWLSQLKIETSTTLSQDAWNLVSVRYENDKFVLSNSLLDAQTAEKLLKEVANQAWTLGEKQLRINLDGKKFVLVAQSAVKTNPVQVARQLGLDTAMSLAKSKFKDLAIADADHLKALDILEGFLIGVDDGAAFKSKNNAEFPKKVTVVHKDTAEVHKRLEMSKALLFTKWLQDAPSNFINPEQFAVIAKDLFEKSAAELLVLGRKEMQQLGMGSFLSVAHGAASDPKLLAIKITGKNPGKTVALVGKGVTFDAGGINIKPSAGLEEMKFDMSGAAAVLGAAMYFTAVQPPVSVVCALGAVENMLGPHATKPGDVVTAFNGKTIEILNTDAEGRLVLADVLSYVIDKFKPELVLDIATLTGAVIMGLGHVGAGIMVKEQKTADFLKKVSERVGEPLWQLPMWPELESEVSSQLADYKNIAKASVKAGPIMGAMFLREFVKDSNCEWAHIDIAGTAWTCGATGYHTNGGSGFGLRAMVGAAEMYLA
jgi:leucyl aminopeptidase